MPFGFGKPREKTIKVPFEQAVRGGQLLEGKAVGIKGKINGEFFVNLMTGPDHKGKEQDDISVHVNYRPKEGWVVNSRVDNTWGFQETFPIDEDLKDGEEVYIRIEPHERDFVIFANGQKICDRRYAVPLNRVNFILVDGKIELHRLQFEGNFYMVPFEHDLRSGFGAGHTLYVTGKPEEEAKKFQIKFLVDEENTALLLEPRFEDEVFVRNTYKEKKWQDEERTGTFPFIRGQVFDMIVESHDNRFVVFVDGHEVFSYFHRIPPAEIKKIELDGHLEVQSIAV